MNLSKSALAFLLIGLVAIPSIYAVAVSMHTTRTSFMLMYSNNPHCLFVDSNGLFIDNKSITELNVSPIPGTQTTFAIGIKNVFTAPLNVTSISAITNDTNLSVNVSPGILAPIVLAANSTLPASLIVTQLKPGTGTSLPIQVTASCS